MIKRRGVAVVSISITTLRNPTKEYEAEMHP